MASYIISVARVCVILILINETGVIKQRQAKPGITLYMGSANEMRLYFATSSRIGRAHTPGWSLLHLVNFSRVCFISVLSDHIMKSLKRFFSYFRELLMYSQSKSTHFRYCYVESVIMCNTQNVRRQQMDCRTPGIHSLHSYRGYVCNIDRKIDEMYP